MLMSSVNYTLEQQKEIVQAAMKLMADHRHATRIAILKGETGLDAMFDEHAIFNITFEHLSMMNVSILNAIARQQCTAYEES